MGGKTSMVTCSLMEILMKIQSTLKGEFPPTSSTEKCFSLWMYMWSCKLLGVLSHLLHILHLYLVDLCLNKWCEFQFLTELKILPQPWITHLNLYLHLCLHVSMWVEKVNIGFGPLVSLWNIAGAWMSFAFIEDFLGGLVVIGVGVMCWVSFLTVALSMSSLLSLCNVTVKIFKCLRLSHRFVDVECDVMLDCAGSVWLTLSICLFTDVLVVDGSVWLMLSICLS